MVKEKYRKSKTTGRWLMKNLHGQFTIVLPKAFNPTKFLRRNRNGK